MVPPVYRILSLDSPARVVPGAITITSAERVNNWNEKIMKRLRTLVSNSDELILNKSVEDYYRWIKDQLTCLKERHLIREKIPDHLYILHLSYIRLRDQELIKSRSYLNTMEKLLCVVCNLELEIVSNTRHNDMASVTRPMINMLHIYLHDEINRILHVLLMLSERFLNQSSYKLIMNIVYKYFLVIVPVINTADLNFCLHFLIYQKWKKTKPESAHAGMDKFMCFTFNKPQNAIYESSLLRNILKPSNEVINCVDNHVNGVEAKITRYFKYFEEAQEVVTSPTDTDTTPKTSEEYDPYQIEFVQSTLYVRTLSIKNKKDSLNLLTIVSKRDEVVIIEDDDEGPDVEMVPLVQNDENMGKQPTENLISTTMDIADAIKSADASKLVPLFNSINIASIKNPPAEKEDLSFSEWVSNKDKPEINFELIKYLKAVLDDLYSKAQNNDKEFPLTNALDTVPKQYPCQEKLDTSKLQLKETACNTNTTEGIKHHEFLSESTRSSEDQNLGELILLKDNPMAKEVPSNEVQTNAATCTYCHHSVANSNLPEISPQIEIVSKPNYKNVEIQTDTGITITNVYNFRSVIETPPSDLDNCISPSETTYTFSTPINEYVKEDNSHCLSEMYCESGGILAYGDCATQVYSTQLDIQDVNQEEEIKTQDESYDIHFTEDTPTSNNNEFTNEYELESHVAIMDSSSINHDDGVKIAELEEEEDSEIQQDECDIDSSYFLPTIEAETCLNDNNPSATETNSKVAEPVYSKDKTNNSSKKRGRKSLNTQKQQQLNTQVQKNLPSAEFDKITSVSTVTDISEQTTTKELADNNENLTESLSSNSQLRESSPSPAYEDISIQELQHHLREAKKRKRTGILKTTRSSATNENELHRIGNGMVLRPTKRKSVITDDEEIPTPKSKKVNFVDPPVVKRQKVYTRHIPVHVIEQAKDSMYIHNIHKQDTKLIYLQPCISMQIIPYTKFLEDHKLREISTYNKNVNNRFINKSLTLRDEIPTSSIERIDYKKYTQNNESLTPNPDEKYSRICFHTFDDGSESYTENERNCIMECLDDTLTDPADIIQNAVKFYINANLVCDLIVPLTSEVYKLVTEYVLDLEGKDKAEDQNDFVVAMIEVSFISNKSSYIKYQEKEMPIKKRRFPTTDGTETTSQDLSSTENLNCKTNNSLPSCINLLLVMKDISDNNTELFSPYPTNFVQSNVSNVHNFQTCQEDCYPAGPVISIAEVQDQQRFQNKTFKTPAERKEFPTVSTYYPPADPLTVTENPSPIITDQVNVNNHTYNNPTINYHMGNMSLPYCNMACFPLSTCVLPYHTLLLQAAALDPTSYDTIKLNTTVNNGQSSTCENVKQDKKI